MGFCGKMADHTQACTMQQTTKTIPTQAIHLGSHQGEVGVGVVTGLQSEQLMAGKCTPIHTY